MTYKLYFNWVKTFRTADAPRPRIDNTGSWVELSCVALYTSTTQLNSTPRQVKLCRYKRGLNHYTTPQHTAINNSLKYLVKLFLLLFICLFVPTIFMVNKNFHIWLCSDLDLTHDLQQNLTSSSNRTW